MLGWLPTLSGLAVCIRLFAFIRPLSAHALARPFALLMSFARLTQLVLSEEIGAGA